MAFDVQNVMRMGFLMHNTTETYAVTTTSAMFYKGTLQYTIEQRYVPLQYDGLLISLLRRLKIKLQIRKYQIPSL